MSIYIYIYSHAQAKDRNVFYSSEITKGAISFIAITVIMETRKRSSH